MFFIYLFIIIFCLYDVMMVHGERKQILSGKKRKKQLAALFIYFFSSAESALFSFYFSIS